MLKMERISSSRGASQAFIQLMKRRVWILAEVVSEEVTVGVEAVISEVASEEASVGILVVASEGAEVISEVVLEEAEVISGADLEEAVEISEAALEVEVVQGVADTSHSTRTVRQGI